MRALIPVLVLTLPAWAQEEKTTAPVAEEIFYLRFETKDGEYSMSLQREGAGGKDLGQVALKRTEMPLRLRATGDGTILAVRRTGLVEWNREGKPLATLEPKGLAGFTDAHKLSADLYLVAGRREAKNVIAEIDAKGKVVREVEVSFTGKDRALRSAWPVGKDRLLVCGFYSAFEMDWTGKRTAEYAVSGLCYDVMPAKEGNVLVATKGSIEERTPADKVVWSAKHGCPTAIQRLPSGNLLASGG